jgi:hypothetical protein
MTKSQLHKYYWSMVSLLILLLTSGDAFAEEAKKSSGGEFSAEENFVLKIVYVAWDYISPWIMVFGQDNWLMMVAGVGVTLLTISAIFFSTKHSHQVGRVGGAALIGLIVAIGLMVVGWAIGMLQGLIVGVIGGFLMAIPIVGTLLSWWGKLRAAIMSLISLAVSLIMFWKIIQYLTSSGSSVAERLITLWKEQVIAPARGDYKPIHVIAAAIFISGIFNKLCLSNEYTAFLAYAVWASGIGLPILRRKWIVQYFKGCDEKGVYEDGRWKCLRKVKKGKKGKEKTCGHVNKAGVRFCGGCGERWEHDPWDCKACKKRGNPPDAIACEKCGGKREVAELDPGILPSTKAQWTCECGERKIPGDKEECPECEKSRWDGEKLSDDTKKALEKALGIAVQNQSTSQMATGQSSGSPTIAGGPSAAAPTWLQDNSPTAANLVRCPSCMQEQREVGLYCKGCGNPLAEVSKTRAVPKYSFELCFPPEYRRRNR